MGEPAGPDRDALCFERVGAPPRRLVVAFGPAGVGANWWGVVADQLPADVHLVAPRLPGRESRMDTPALGTAAAVVADVLGWLGPELSDPAGVVVVGVCSGAVLAARLAGRLRELGGRGPEVVVVNPPSVSEVDAEPVATLSSAELAAALRAEAAVPPLVAGNPAIFRFFEPTIRADLAIVESALREVLSTPFPVRVHAQRPNLASTAEWLAVDELGRAAEEVPGEQAELMSDPAAVLAPILSRVSAGSHA
jgi:surfactin synthase thioesterase subunit